ncbi:hypothetical protein R3P38DRAFT_2872249, partial [Favolaschia claudopus]
HKMMPLSATSLLALLSSPTSSPGSPSSACFVSSISPLSVPNQHQTTLQLTTCGGFCRPRRPQPPIARTNRHLWQLARRWSPS